FLKFPPSDADARKQEKETDFDFLTRIAKENGFEMFIDHTASPKGRILKFKFLISEFTPSLTLKWGASLKDFTPRLTTIGDVFGVSVRVWVESLQTEFVIVASWDFDRASLNLSIYPSLVGAVEDLLGDDAK